MASLAPQTALAVCIIAVTAVLGMLYALATLVRDQTALDDLKARVDAVRRQYAVKRAGDDEILIVDEAPPEEQPARKAA